MDKKALKNKHVAPKRGKMNALSIVLFVLLIVYCLGIFIPIIWSTVISFMDYTDYLFTWTNGRDKELAKIFFSPTFENFKTAWSTLPIQKNNRTFQIWEVFLNSIIYSGGCAFCITLVSCVVGYVTARFKFRFSGIIYTFVIVAITLPLVGSSAGELSILDSLGIRGTFFSMFLLRFNFLTIYYMMFYAQFSTIPKDYTEAAKMDGASNWSIMTRVIMPQAIPLMVTVFILTFIGYWNDIEIPVLYLPNYPTAAYRLYDYVTNTQSGAGTAQTPVQMAATLIMCVPIIIIFFIVNKRLRINVAMGGIKG